MRFEITKPRNLTNHMKEWFQNRQCLQNENTIFHMKYVTNEKGAFRLILCPIMQWVHLDIFFSKSITNPLDNNYIKMCYVSIKWTRKSDTRQIIIDQGDTTLK